MADQARSHTARSGDPQPGHERPRRDERRRNHHARDQKYRGRRRGPVRSSVGRARRVPGGAGGRHRHRHERGRTRSGFPAVLHHQAAREGHRAGAGGGARHLAAGGRPRAGRQRAREGSAVHPAVSEIRRSRTCTGPHQEARVRPCRDRDRPPRRRRGRSAGADAAVAGVLRLPRSSGGQPCRGDRVGGKPHRRNCSPPDRCRDAGDERPGALRAHELDAARNPRRLHVGISRGHRRQARRGRKRSRSTCRSRSR